MLFALLFIYLGLRGRIGNEVSHLQACKVQSSFLQIIGEEEKLQTAIALSMETFGCSYELLFDAVVGNEIPSGVGTRAEGFEDLQAKRARYLVALMLNLGRHDVDRLAKGLMFLSREGPTETLMSACISHSRFREDLLNLLLRYEEDPQTLRLLLSALRD